MTVKRVLLTVRELLSYAALGFLVVMASTVGFRLDPHHPAQVVDANTGISVHFVPGSR
jgi:hypothetical protein